MLHLKYRKYEKSGRIMRTQIELKNMRFFACHGVFAQETVVGGDFVVNLKIEADLSEACEKDELRDTINYAEVFELVRKEMQISSKLIENVAYRIRASVRNRFPQIKGMEVRVSKISPPISGEMECAEIIIID